MNLQTTVKHFIDGTRLVGKRKCELRCYTMTVVVLNPEKKYKSCVIVVLCWTWKPLELGNCFYGNQSSFLIKCHFLPTLEAAVVWWNYEWCMQLFLSRIRCPTSKWRLKQNSLTLAHFQVNIIHIIPMSYDFLIREDGNVYRVLVFKWEATNAWNSYTSWITVPWL